LKRKPALNFESNLIELERLVERMERGELTLEDSLQQFEQGIRLIRACQQALHTAEQKVQVLTREGEHETLRDFEGLHDDDPEEDKT